MTMTTNYITKDTGESITFNAPHGRDDAQGYSLDGYDWMDEAAHTGWYALANWGKDGWDAGSWPYVIITLAKGSDEEGPFYGITTYCEGDLATTFYRSQLEQWKAITAWNHWNWVMGQSQGPKDLPADLENLDLEIYGRPFGDEYDGKVAA
jgi:hypothetical protein